MQPYIFNGQFVKNAAYKKVVWALIAMLFVVALLTYVMSNNMLLSVFGFLTMLIAALALLIFMKDRYALEIEILRTAEKKFEVFVNGADMYIINPQVVYFGINQDTKGQKFLNLGIPNGTSLLVLQEKIKEEASLKEVPNFLIPREFLGQDTFESKKQGDLKQIAKVFGFI